MSRNVKNRRCYNASRSNAELTRNGTEFTTNYDLKLIVDTEVNEKEIGNDNHLLK